MSSGEGHPWLADSLPIIEPAFLAEILHEVADIALAINRKGVVMSAVVNEGNLPVTSLDHWVGNNLADYLTEECEPKFQRVLSGRRSGSQVMRVELNHCDGQEWQYPVKYSVHQSDRAEDTILMLGQDLGHVVETQQKLVHAQLALEQGYEEQREYDARYRMLMSVAREAFVLVEVASGQIQDLNEAAATILGSTRDALTGKSFAAEFKNRNRAEFVENIFALASAEDSARIVAQPRKSGEEIGIAPVGFRAGGQRMLICRLDTGDTEVPVSDQLVENLGLLFRRGPEAIIFVNGKGVIRHANEAFLRMVDLASSADIKGRSVADNLLRGQVDLNVLLDNSAREGGLKGYATKLCSEVGVSRPVEVSATLLADAANPTIGLIFRDTSTKDMARAAPERPETMPAGSVVNLVGSASLKEIVSQTTDVIERMCIETAIELTGNNRAAAAEMLGLSRQSLYVKLNKYGIEDKSGDG